MAGARGRSGGRRIGAGAKRKVDLEELHTLFDAYVTRDVWALMIDALVKRALQGDVQAFRELRACRFGQIPLAFQGEDQPMPPIHTIEVERPCTRRHVDENRP